MRLTIAIGDYAQIVFWKITDTNISIDHIYISFFSKKKMHNDLIQLTVSSPVHQRIKTSEDAGDEAYDTMAQS